MTTYNPINYDFHRLVVFTILAGTVIAILGISITLLAQYQQIGNLIFSQLPSNLGNYIRSPLAYIFNMGLILTGICMLLAMYGLQQLALNRFSYAIALAGSAVGISIILMGIYPINYLFEHRLFSTVFLISTLSLYCISLLGHIHHKNICPTPLVIVSLLGVCCASVLAGMLNWTDLSFAPCPHGEQAPCLLTYLLWCQIHLVLIWCIILALSIKTLAKKSYYESISAKLAITY